MANFSDMEKIRNILQGANEQKIAIGTSICWHSQFWGKVQNLEKYRIFSLNKSNGPKYVNGDELEQKLKQIVYHTAHLDGEKTRDQIASKVKILYPNNHYIVFVWQAGNICQTGWKNGGVSQAKFKTIDDKNYGHDILVLIY